MLVVIVQSVLVLTVFFVTCVSILVPSSLLMSGHHWVLQDPPVLRAGGGYPEFSVLVFVVMCVSILVPSTLLISGYYRVPR